MEAILTRLMARSYKEGTYTVLTELNHLQRGWCCGNGCRHCPYQKDVLTLVEGRIYYKLKPLVKKALLIKVEQDLSFKDSLPEGISKQLDQ